ncbi:MAG: beta strand repeat-containing protein [Niastella sp.]|uniref:beta strand repeat-containing protein n=1 Tax=Niastella sp. TaxID=1869183 RepID=UPI003899D9F5
MRKLLGIVLSLLSCAGIAQTVTPVPVTGFNADVIANGPTFTGAVTDDVDGGKYYFLNQSFTAFGAPTNYLPTSGLINSAASSLVTFQLADASVNNSLRLPTTLTTGTLTLTTPQTAGVVYFLATSGGSATVMSVTLNFADGTTQTNPSVTVSDWFGGTGFAIQGIGRVNGNAPAGLDNSGGTTNPRLYQVAMAVNGPNYTKKINSITISRPATGGILHVMAVSIMNACVAPANQPTALVLNAISTSQINGSFTASPAADAYIVVRYPAGATPVAPVNGTTYPVGSSLGTGLVVQATTATSFSASGLIGGAGYDFYVYAYNNTNCIGPVYNTTTPLTGTRATNTCSGPSGVIPVGPNETYKTLTAALAALSGGVSGPVTLELQSNYTSATETFPIVIASNACFSAANTLTIRPAAGANGLVIASSGFGATIDLNGAKYVTIDGRPGGTGSAIPVTAAGNLNNTNLNIINTNNTGAAIALENGAFNNTIKYCDLQGQNTNDASQPNTLSGVVYFSNTGANGNDNNTLDHCNIHSTGTSATKPSIGVYSLGYDNSSAVAAYAAQFNDNNAVLGCNMYDYFSTGNSVGLELNLGNSGWTIAANHFFQTETITVSGSTSAFNRAIWVAPYRAASAGEIGNGFIIIGNFIGGSAPNCGGTPYTFANGSAGFFEAIRLEVADAATPLAASSIQGNTITNINLTTSTTNDAMHAIAVLTGKGNVEIGNNTGNSIGAATGSNGSSDGGITINATGAVPSHMIFFGGTYNTIVKNNTIGNVLLTAVGSSFSGIYANSAITGNFSNNTITNITASNTGITTGRFINGIHIPSGSPVLTIANNIIQNLTCNYATTGTAASQVIGINIASTTAVMSGGITGNTIRNLVNATQSTGTTTSSAIIGINMNSSNAAGCAVSGNTIHSLVLSGTATNAAVNAIGLYYSGTTSVTNAVSKNFIYSFDATAVNIGAVFTGIQVNGGSSVYSNNMIRLGVKPDGTPLTTGLVINGMVGNTTSANSFFHNSVYIGGSGVGMSTNNTYAFSRLSTSGTCDLRNNIFANVRSNANGGGKHFSINFGGATTGATVNYNVYQFNGSGGRFANSGAVEIPTYMNGGTPTTGWLAGDVNSITGDPNFINPTGNLSAVNLHINTTGISVAEGTGTAIASITDDYDNDTRSGLTPVDIGADAGNFVAAAATCNTPNAPTGLVLTAVSATEIDGSFTASAGGANGYMIVRYLAGATPVAPVNGVIYSVGSSLGTGTVVATGSTQNFANTNLLASTAYDYYVYAYNNACISAIKYSTAVSGSKSTAGCTGPSGLITVGQTGTFQTLTAALASLSGGISGPVIVELKGDYTSANETFPITIGSNACFSPVNTVLIRPAANASGLVITSSIPGPTIDLTGGTYVTIDGRPGGTGAAIAVTTAGNLNTINLNIINTSALGAAIRFDNGAFHNTVKYCDLQGMNAVPAATTSAGGGVVFFGSNGANGNDNNTIDHCNIHSSGTGPSIPSIGVYALGANNTGVNANFNDNDTVSNCNIYDYFLVNGNSAGVMLNNGVNSWVVFGNHFFQTSARIYSAAAFNRGIWIIPNRNTGSVGNGFVVTNNAIGGAAPACTGTPYTLSGLGNSFDGIRLEIADGTSANPSSVQGNTITNIAITSTVTGDVFHGIGVTGSNGSVNVGTITGNTVGAVTGTNAITIAGGNGAHTIPYYISGNTSTTAVINLKQNNTGGITLSNAGNNFSGIYDNTAGVVNIDGNQIGSVTTANSINAVNTSTSSIYVRGINIPAGNGVFAITNNTIANLTNNATSANAGAQVAGINIGSATSTVSTVAGNTVRNLYSATTYTLGSGNSAVLGIYMGASTSNPVTVTNNTVHSLVSGAATASVYMEGIFFWGANSATITNTISKNKVHSFDITTANTNANIRGIEINQGKADVYNNMVRLGIKPDGTSLTNAIRIDGIMKGSGLNSSIFYNSIYIGGTGIGTNAMSSNAFRKETNTGTDNVQNNIFVNNRSNATTGGLHNAIWVNALAGMTFDHNIYGYGGTGGNFAAAAPGGASFAATYTSGWNIGGDLASQAADPLFIDATGAATTVDLHITTAAVSPANGAAVPFTLVTDDIDGEARNATTPDVGADEFSQLNGIDMQAVSLETPLTGKGCYGKEAATIKVRNNSAAIIDFAVNPVTVTVNVTGAATATITKIINTGTLAAGATMNVLLNGTTDSVNMSVPGTYIFNAKTTVTGDAKASNDAMSMVTRTRVALVSGIINASQTSYCFNGAPVLTVTGGDGFAGIQWQQSTDSATYSNITGGITSPYTTAAATQTLYYRLASVCITDTVFTPAIKVEVNSPAVTATTPAARCNAGVVNLQATGSAGSTLYWYPDPATTSPIGIGSTYTTPSISATTTYYVSAVAGSCTTPRTAVVATVNSRIAITTQPAGSSVCMGSAVNLRVAANGSALTYQWRKDGVNITNATTDTYAIANAVGADAGDYDVVITNACGLVISNVATLAVKSSNNWVGAVSSDWNTAANWCGGVPVATTDVSITSGTPFSPVISGAAHAHSVTIGTGATLTINGTGTLNLYGNFANTGTLNANTGTIAFRGTANQTINALSVGNVIVNGAGVTLNGNLTIGSTLTMTNGNITVGSFNIYLQNATTGSVASHIITNGTGSAIVTNSTGAITVPVGPTATSYNPVMLSNGQGMTYTVRVMEGLIASVIDNSKAINRTWTVTTTREPAAPVNISLQYADADANAACNPSANMDAGAYNGITWALVSPTGGVLPTGSSTARLVALSTTQLGSIVITNQGMLKAPVYEFSVQLLPTVVTTGNAKLRITSRRTMTMTWAVLDATGAKVKKFTTSLSAGINDINVSLAGLANGVYTLRGVGDDGRIQTIRFVVTH